MRHVREGRKEAPSALSGKRRRGWNFWLKMVFERGVPKGGFQHTFNLLIPLHRIHTLLMQLSMPRSGEYAGYHFLGFSLRLPVMVNSIFELGNPWMEAHK